MGAFLKTIFHFSFEIFHLPFQTRDVLALEKIGNDDGGT